MKRRPKDYIDGPSLWLPNQKSLQVLLPQTKRGLFEGAIILDVYEQWLTHPSHFCLPIDYRVFQMAVRGRRYSHQLGEWKILLGGNFLLGCGNLMRSDFNY